MEWDEIFGDDWSGEGSPRRLTTVAAASLVGWDEICGDGEGSPPKPEITNLPNPVYFTQF